MRIFHFFLRSSKNCLYNGSWSNIRTNFYSNCLLGTPLKFFKFNLVRSFLIYHSLLKNNLRSQSVEDECNSEKKEVTVATKTKNRPTRVSVINETGQELVMELSDAEKYAKRKKMRLALVDGVRKDKIKYKLVKKNVSGSKDIKKLALREEIGAHDLETKLNQVLKLLNKGLRVMCFIEGTSGSEKMNNVLNTFEKSKLNEFLVSKNKVSRGFHIVYQGKVCDKEETTE